MLFSTNADQSIVDQVSLTQTNLNFAKIRFNLITSFSKIITLLLTVRCSFFFSIAIKLQKLLKGFKITGKKSYHFETILIYLMNSRVVMNHSNYKKEYRINHFKIPIIQ